MNLYDFFNGEDTILVPNPKYKPHSRKNKQPKYLEVLNLGEQDIPNYITGSTRNLEDRWNVDKEVADKYSKYGLTYNKVRDIDLELFEAQPMINKAWNSLTQALWNEGFIGTLKGFSDTADFLYNLVVNKQIGGNDYSNPISKALEGYQEEFRESHPIYEDPNKDIFTGSLTSLSYYLNRAPSIATTLSLLIPGFAVSKGVSLLGKVSGVGKLIGNARKYATGLNRVTRAIDEGADIEKLGLGSRAILALNNEEGIIKMANQGFEFAINASIQRIMENYQESRQVYNDLLPTSIKKLKEMSDKSYAEFLKRAGSILDDVDKNDREQVAAALAKASADLTFKEDLWNGIFDFVQLMALRNINLRGFNGKSRATVRREHLNSIRYPGLTGKALKAKLKERPWYIKVRDKADDWIYGSRHALAAELSEGVEEAVNYIAQQDGMTYGHVLLYNLPKMDDWDVRLINYMKQPGLYDSFMWGVIGGVAFHAAGSKLNQLSNAIKVTADERERKKKYNPEGSEQEDTRDRTSWWSRFMLPEVKARVNNIRNRWARANVLMTKLKDIQAGKNPLVKGGVFANDNSEEDKIEKQVTRDKLFNDEETNILLNAAFVGNFDSTVDFLMSDAWVEYMSNNTGVTKEEMEKRRQDVLKKAEKIKRLYNAEMLAMGNALRGKDNQLGLDYSKTPIEILQLIAAENISHRLSIDNLNESIKKYESLRGTLETSFEKELARSNINYREAVRLFAISQQLSQINAEIEAINNKKGKKPEGREIIKDARDVKGQYTLKELERRRDVLTNILENDNITVPDNLRGEAKESYKQRERLARMLNVIRLANATVIRDNLTMEVDETNARYAKIDSIIENAYKSDEANWGSHRKLLTELNKGFGNLSLNEYKEAYDRAKIIDENLGIALTRESQGAIIKGLSNISEPLLNTYTQLSVYEMQKAIEESYIVHKRDDVTQRVFGLINEGNDLRSSIIEVALNILKGLGKKYAKDYNDQHVGEEKFEDILAYGNVIQQHRDTLKSILSENELKMYDDAITYLAYNNERVTGKKGYTGIENIPLPEYVKKALWKSSEDEYSDYVEPDEQSEEETQERTVVPRLLENIEYYIYFDKEHDRVYISDKQKDGAINAEKIKIKDLNNGRYYILFDKYKEEHQDQQHHYVLNDLDSFFDIKNGEDFLNGGVILENPQIQWVNGEDEYQIIKKGTIGKKTTGVQPGGNQDGHTDDFDFDLGSGDEDVDMENMQNTVQNTVETFVTFSVGGDEYKFKDVGEIIAKINEELVRFGFKNAAGEQMTFDQFDPEFKAFINQIIDDNKQHLIRPKSSNQQSSTIFDNSGNKKDEAHKKFTKKLVEEYLTRSVKRITKGLIYIDEENFYRYLWSRVQNDDILERLYDETILALRDDYATNRLYKDRVLAACKLDYLETEKIDGKTLDLNYHLYDKTDDEKLEIYKALDSLIPGKSIIKIRRKHKNDKITEPIIAIEFYVEFGGKEVTIGGVAYNEPYMGHTIYSYHRGWKYDTKTDMSIKDSNIRNFFKALLVENRSKDSEIPRLNNKALIDLLFDNITTKVYEDKLVNNKPVYTREYIEFTQKALEIIKNLVGEEELKKYISNFTDLTDEKDVAVLIAHLHSVYKGISSRINRYVAKGEISGNTLQAIIDKLSEQSIDNWVDKIQQGAIVALQYGSENGLYSDATEVMVDTVNEGALVITSEENALIPSQAIKYDRSQIDVAKASTIYRGQVQTTNEQKVIQNTNLKAGSPFIIIKRKDGRFEYVHAYSLKSSEIDKSSDYYKIGQAVKVTFINNIKKWLANPNKTADDLRMFMAELCDPLNGIFRGVSVDIISKEAGGCKISFFYDDKPHTVFFFDKTKTKNQAVSVIDLGKNPDNTNRRIFWNTSAAERDVLLKEIEDHLDKSLTFNITEGLIKEGNATRNGSFSAGKIIFIEDAVRGKKAFKLKIGSETFTFASYKDFILGNDKAAPVKLTTKPDAAGSNFVRPDNYFVKEQERPKVTYRPVTEEILPTGGVTESETTKKVKSHIVNKQDGRTIIEELLTTQQFEAFKNSIIFSALDFSRIKHVSGFNDDAYAAHFTEDDKIDGIEINKGDVVVSNKWFSIINRGYTEAASRYLLHEVIHRYLSTVDENEKKDLLDKLDREIITPLRKYINNNPDSNEAKDALPYLFTRKSDDGNYNYNARYCNADGSLNYAGKEEFLIESMIRPKLMDVLNSIDKDGNKITDSQNVTKEKTDTLFKEIIRLICELFGVNIVNNSLLEAEYNLFTNFASKSKPDNSGNNPTVTSRGNKGKRRGLTNKNKNSSIIEDDEMSYYYLRKVLSNDVIENLDRMINKGAIIMKCKL